MRQIRSAEIIAVGSELLTPDRLDTNSLFLTDRLNAVGIDVAAKVVVGDERRALAVCLREAFARADLVITTGGLGPTDDDVTRDVAAEVMEAPLTEDASLVASLEARFARRQIPMPAINRRQALVPAGATVLANPQGTAPGLWLDDGRRSLLLLPGPSRELQPLFDTEVLPALRARGGGRVRRRRVVKVTGLTESQVEDRIRSLDRDLRSRDVPVERTILASPGLIEIHLAASGVAGAELEAALEQAVADTTALVGPAVYSVDGRSLEEVVGGLLARRGWRLAAAESCTGGLLLGRLTNVPGSSAWVAGGVVAYANEVKVAQLGVPESWIAEHGAVSEPVAQAMADGVRERLGAEVGIGLTGIAGPGGGTEGKPVGTVAIALSGPVREVRTFRFPGDRSMVRALAVAAGLNMVRRAAE